MCSTLPPYIAKVKVTQKSKTKKEEEEAKIIVLEAQATKEGRINLSE
jgi:hypothetical protein